MSDVPEMKVVAPRPSRWRNLSPVWLVPVLALAVSLGIAWRSYSDRGTLVRISFENASGVTAGETTLRYRDVTIGTVETVSFTSDLSRVIVSARVQSAVAETIPTDAEFWVVRPEVSTRGITGLNTVLSGVYIQGVWTPIQDAENTSFTGKEQAPLVEPGQKGTRIIIRAANGNQLKAGAPVFYRGIEVGRIEQPELSRSGDSVIVHAFIEAPYDQRLTTAARFWDMSGFSVSFGPGGLSLDVASIASLVTGGVAFDTVLDNGTPIRPDREFELYDDEKAARDSVLSSLGDNAVKFSITFEGTLNGLTSGAPVTYKGIRVGQVQSIGAVVETQGARRVVTLRTTVAIDPQALGLPEGAGTTDLMSFLQSAVQQGLRARLATQNLFSSALLVELVDLPEAAPAMLQVPEGELPILPSVASDIPDVTATAEGVLKRIDALPIEDLMNQAITLMASIQKITDAESTRAAPDKLVGLIDEARGLVGSPDTQALPGELRQTVANLQALTADLQQRGIAERLAAALESADKAAASVSAVSDEVPALVSDIRAVAQKAEALDIETLVASARQVLSSADRILDTDSARDLPPALTDALGQVRDLVAEFRQKQGTDRLVAALQGAQTAAQDVSASVAGVPELTQKLNALADKANALDAASLVNAATALMQNADGLIGTDAARQLPASMNGALDEVRTALAELREGGLVTNANAAMQSARDAADAVAQATETLPALADRLDRVAGQAESVLSAYGAQSTFNRDTLAMLRELRDAARAVSALARSIERKPNSLILGR